jgi:16S rRNA (guanine527-N7)-methyltransferase
VSDALPGLREGARGILGRPLSDREAGLFKNYLEILAKWQGRFRLVGSIDPAWVVPNLFLDSLLFLRAMPQRFDSVLDLGAGAGIPGIPLKIVLERVSFTLIEAKRRRASFLTAVVRELGLSGAEVIGRRAEEVADDLGGSFDVVVTRCTGRMETMWPLAARFLRPGGIAVASGPPSSKPLEIGSWIEVPGSHPGQSRRFAVLRRN